MLQEMLNKIFLQASWRERGDTNKIMKKKCWRTERAY